MTEPSPSGVAAVPTTSSEERPRRGRPEVREVARVAEPQQPSVAAGEVVAEVPTREGQLVRDRTVDVGAGVAGELELHRCARDRPRPVVGGLVHLDGSGGEPALAGRVVHHVHQRVHGARVLARHQDLGGVDEREHVAHAFEYEEVLARAGGHRDRASVRRGNAVRLHDHEMRTAEGLWRRRVHCCLGSTDRGCRQHGSERADPGAQRGCEALRAEPSDAQRWTESLPNRSTNLRHPDPISVTSPASVRPPAPPRNGHWSRTCGFVPAPRVMSAGDNGSGRHWT